MLVLLVYKVLLCHLGQHIAAPLPVLLTRALNVLPLGVLFQGIGLPHHIVEASLVQILAELPAAVVTRTVQLTGRARGAARARPPSGLKAHGCLHIVVRLQSQHRQLQEMSY